MSPEPGAHNPLRPPPAGTSRGSPGSPGAPPGPVRIPPPRDPAVRAGIVRNQRVGVGRRRSPARARPAGGRPPADEPATRLRHGPAGRCPRRQKVNVVDVQNARRPAPPRQTPAKWRDAGLGKRPTGRRPAASNGLRTDARLACQTGLPATRSRQQQAARRFQPHRRPTGARRQHPSASSKPGQPVLAIEPA